MSIEVTASLLRDGGVGANQVELELTQRTMPHLEQWTVSHRLDESSPLHGVDLSERLAELRVLLTLFDAAHDTQVRVYKIYDKTAIRRAAKFVDMMVLDVERKRCYNDHSKIDLYEELRDLPELSMGSRKHMRRVHEYS